MDVVFTDRSTPGFGFPSPGLIILALFVLIAAVALAALVVVAVLATRRAGESETLRSMKTSRRPRARVRLQAEPRGKAGKTPLP
jgi:hypothetical protein